MSKRSSGEGTIVRRKDGRWAGAITLPDGKRKWVYGKTQGEVAKKIAAKRHDRDAGLPVAYERRTVESYLHSWLEMIRPAVKPKMWQSYEYVSRVHLIPDLGKTQLAKLTPEAIQRWLAKKRDALSLTIGKPLSPTTVRYLHTVLHVALEEAVRLGITARNPAAGLRKPKRGKRETKWWTSEQARAVLQAAQEDPSAAPYYPLFLLALSTGMRMSEMLGLRWRDVDLEKRSLHVQYQLQWTKTALGRAIRIEELKTTASRRHITISGSVAAALKAHCAAQHAERLKLGPLWRDNDLVFTNAIGGGVDLGNFRSRIYLPVVRRAGVPYIRPHDMRHTAATLAILEGMPIKAVSEMLGHSSVAITMTIYAHVLPDSHAAVAETMDHLLLGTSTPGTAAGRGKGSRGTSRAKNPRRTHRAYEEERGVEEQKAAN